MRKSTREESVGVSKNVILIVLCAESESCLITKVLCHKAYPLVIDLDLVSRDLEESLFHRPTDDSYCGFHAYAHFLGNPTKGDTEFDVLSTIAIVLADSPR